MPGTSEHVLAATRRITPSPGRRSPTLTSGHPLSSGTPRGNDHEHSGYVVTYDRSAEYQGAAFWRSTWRGDVYGGGPVVRDLNADALERCEAEASTPAAHLPPTMANEPVRPGGSPASVAGPWKTKEGRLSRLPSNGGH